MDTRTRESDVGGRTRLGIGTGDALVVAAVLLFGLVSHGTNPIAEPLSALETVLPFVLGWLLAATLADPYDAATLASPVRGARMTTVTWLAAANLGLVARTSPALEGGVAWPFGLVITVTGLVALLVWRLGVVLLTDRTGRR